MSKPSLEVATAASGTAGGGGTHVRVLIADDDVNIREALYELLKSEDGVEVVAIAVDAGQAITAAARMRPDVAILDVRMPRGGGLQAARGILRVSPGTRIIALSACADRANVLAMLDAGAEAYLVKGSMPEVVMETVQRALHTTRADRAVPPPAQ